jgi:phenylpyruvate tautomerase PptA (4-oxalocrotonate tautomerase family)
MRLNMPLVKISILKGRSKQEKTRLLDVIHTSLIESFDLPEHERTPKLCEFDRDEFEIPSDRTDYFTILEINIQAGRPMDDKRKFYQLTNQKLKKIGYSNPNDIVIIVSEIHPESWGISTTSHALENTPGSTI